MEGNELLTLGQDIAGELGTEWSASQEYAHGVYLNRADGLRLFANTEWNSRDKLTIRASYPHGAHRLMYPAPATGEIRVSIGRGAATIAREITRRCLPTVEAEHKRAREVLDGDSAARAAREAFADSLPFVERRDDDCTSLRVRAGEVFGDLRLYHRAEGARIELHSLTAEQVRAVLEVLR